MYLSDFMVTKQQILDRAKRQLNEVHQYFLDIEHWNSTNLPNDRIDPDPDGRLTQMAHSLEGFITNNSPIIEI